MQNDIVRKSVPELIEKSGVVVAGLTEHGATLGIVRHTAASVTEKLTALTTAVGGRTQAQANLRNSRIAVRAVAVSARRFAMSVRDSLKPTLGNIHSSAWAEVGFTTELAVSFNPAKLKVLLLAIKAYLTRYPEAENATANLTAARANTLYEDLTSSVDTLAASMYSVATAVTTRRSAVSAMRSALRGLINELAEAIDPLSDYWVRFGFNKPGAQETPDVPENVTAALTSTNAVAVQWDAAPRAEHYRVWKKVIGVDAEFVAAGSSAGVDFVIEGLPANSTIEIAVSAVNNGGESQRSEAVSVVTH